MSNELKTNQNFRFLTQNQLEPILFALFIADGSLLLILALFKLLSPTSWIMFGGILLVLALVLVYRTRETATSIFVILLNQFFLRLPWLVRNVHFVYETDEMYHFGLSLLYAYSPETPPIERMLGYSFYPLMDTITAKLLLIVGIPATVFLLTLFYSVFIPCILVLVIDSIYHRFMDPGDHFRIATLVFTSCYRFLFFFSFYIYETGTFLLFGAMLWIILSMSKLKKPNNLFSSYLVIFLLLSALLSVWHYNGVFMGGVLFFVYYVLMRIEKNRYPNNTIYELRAFILPFAFFFLNLFPFFWSPASVLAFSIYFTIVKNVVPIFGNITGNFSFLVVFEAGIIVILVVIFYFFDKLVFLIHKMTHNDWNGMIVRKFMSSTKILIFLFFLSEFILFFLAVLIFNRYQRSDGFRTIGNFGVLTVLTIDGLIHFFLLASLSIFWIEKDIQKIFYFLFLIFSGAAFLTFLYPPSSNPTFPYRLITYIFLFGTPIVMSSITRIKVILTTRLSQGHRKRRNSRFPSKEAVIRFISALLVFLMLSQSITLARWEGYHTSFNLPTADILEMSDWIRNNLDRDEKIFVDFIYISISSFSLRNRLKSYDTPILLSLYYQRNITSLLEILWSTNTSYLVFDQASLAPGFMTKIGRDHVLTSYDVPSSALDSYDITLPPDFLSVYRTRYLVLLKVPPSPFVSQTG